MDCNVNLSERRKGLPCRTERETDARLFCTAAQPVQNAQDALNIDRGILTSCQVRSEHLFFFFFKFQRDPGCNPYTTADLRIGVRWLSEI